MFSPPATNNVEVPLSNALNAATPVKLFPGKQWIEVVTASSRVCV